jgi:hypothetical protein
MRVDAEPVELRELIAGCAPSSHDLRQSSRGGSQASRRNNFVPLLPAPRRPRCRDSELCSASCHSRTASVDDGKTGKISAIQAKPFPVKIATLHPAPPSSALRFDGSRYTCGSCPSFASRQVTGPFRPGATSDWTTRLDRFTGTSSMAAHLRRIR